MPDLSFLRWPFFEPRHAEWRERVATFAEARVAGLIDHHDADASCRRLVTALGEAGLLAPTVVSDTGGRFDVRALCLARETLAWHDGLADFAFALQGLGSGPVSLFGTAEQKRRLPDVAAGKAIPAFALTEPEAGSDVAALATTATADGDHVRLDGEKTYISNGGIADWYVVFARTGEAPGRPRPLRLPGRGRHAGADRRRADRDDRPAPPRPHRLRRLPRPGCESDRR